eukprot:COSAG05_NODE_3011_length_2417_cov_9.420190_1_plen_38_part_10
MVSLGLLLLCFAFCATAVGSYLAVGGLVGCLSLLLVTG